MALVALEFCVTAAQWKLGCLVVTEADHRPLLGNVAGLAIRAVSASVLVLQAVTGDAGPGQIFVSLTSMAFCARYLAVRADQRESRLAVIEGLHATPGLLAVTAVALLAQPALVRIICLVTVETTPGGLTVLCALCVAAVAACPRAGTAVRTCPR